MSQVEASVHACRKKQGPTNPRLLNSIPYPGECAGITEYNGNYLVALYGDRSTIRFYLLSMDSLKIKKDLNREKIVEWKAQNQDKRNWTPLNTWQGDGGQYYENMSLIKEQANSSATPAYYVIMYHNGPEAIDIYSLSGLDFDNLNPPNIQMIKRVEVSKPWWLRNGFRAGGGVYITSPYQLTFFSTRMRLVNKTRINIYR